MLNDALSSAGDSTLLIEDGAASSGPELLSGAIEEVRKLLARGGHGRALIRSRSAWDILTWMAAAEAVGADLFIAHATLPGGVVDQLVSEHGITAVLDRESGGLSERGAGSPSGSGRVLLMTSGTTGAPKVAAHTLESLTGSIRRTESSASARWLLTFPPTSFAGLQVLLSSVLGGGTLISTNDPTPLRLAESARIHAATHISGTPTFWRALLLALGPDDDLPGLRFITLGGEAVDQATLNRLSSRFPEARITHIYASTEAGSLFRVQDKREGFPAEWLDSGFEGIGLRIQNEVLQVRSTRKMLGYASTHEDPVDEAGWVSTGDVVRIDGDRVLFAGRTDSRINVGGYKVSPEEVERVLLEVEGVAEACVTGVPNPITGNALMAELVCAVGFDSDSVKAEAARHARSRLDSYKTPRIVKMVESISVAESGKKVRAS